ncbi:MAG: hypothetical protein H0W64_11295 [Gammaproteobacteria bacterium]|nr:hypothetical protein [Gammaproteobacteria bacterium]
MGIPNSKYATNNNLVLSSLAEGGSEDEALSLLNRKSTLENKENKTFKEENELILLNNKNTARYANRIAALISDKKLDFYANHQEKLTTHEIEILTVAYLAFLCNMSLASGIGFYANYQSTSNSSAANCVVSDTLLAQNYVSNAPFSLMKKEFEASAKEIVDKHFKQAICAAINRMKTASPTLFGTVGAEDNIKKSFVQKADGFLHDRQEVMTLCLIKIFYDLNLKFTPEKLSDCKNQLIDHIMDQSLKIDDWDPQALLNRTMKELKLGNDTPTINASPSP